MSRKRFTAEQIIGFLREVDVKLSQGRNAGQICREMGITEQTYYRWRKEYGGMKTAQIKRLKDLERENGLIESINARLMDEVNKRQGQKWLCFFCYFLSVIFNIHDQD